MASIIATKDAALELARRGATGPDICLALDCHPMIAVDAIRRVRRSFLAEPPDARGTGRAVVENSAARPTLEG